MIQSNSPPSDHHPAGARPMEGHSFGRRDDEPVRKRSHHYERTSQLSYFVVANCNMCGPRIRCAHNISQVFLVEKQHIRLASNSAHHLLIGIPMATASWGVASNS